ncbi:MAG TPA: hypothetical protein VEX39_03475 [Thermoleophilaceae bacterium]|nr:hypothetical protein [Thermoleophilaceae bacterium]
MSRTGRLVVGLVVAAAVALVPATAAADDTPRELRPYLKLRKNHAGPLTYGGHVTLHTEASGALRLLHRVVCRRDVECLVQEVERVIEPLLADLSKSQRDAFSEYFDKATAPSQYGDIGRAVAEWARNGGCVDIHIRTGVNWSQVKRGQHCKAGRAFTIFSRGLALPGALEGKRLFKTTIGRKAYVTVYEKATGELLLGLNGCRRNGLYTVSYCATQVFARVAEEAHTDVRTVQTVLRAAVDQPLDSGNALVGTGGGCLTLQVRAASDPFEWYRRNKSHRECATGDSFF